MQTLGTGKVKGGQKGERTEGGEEEGVCGQGDGDQACRGTVSERQECWLWLVKGGHFPKEPQAGLKAWKKDGRAVARRGATHFHMCRKLIECPSF